MIKQLTEILSSVWMIDKKSALSFIPTLLVLFGKNIDFSAFEKTDYFEEYSSDLQTIKSVSKISLTTEYDSNEIPESSIAIHPVFGVILADSNYQFSTKSFVRNLQLADANPNIIAHFVPVNSPGGDAHYLDIASNAVANLTKPVITHFERHMASAAVYLTSGSTEIYANSKFDRVGSIGTMISYLDLNPILEKFGAKNIEEYATQSTMKNKSNQYEIGSKYYEKLEKENKKIRFEPEYKRIEL